MEWLQKKLLLIQKIEIYKIKLSSMKKLFIALMLLASYSIAQNPPDYSQLMFEPNANYFQIKEVMDEYYSSDVEGSEESENGKEGYERWKYFWKDRVVTFGDENSIGRFSNQANAIYGLGIQDPICNGSTTKPSDWTVLSPLEFHTQSMGVIVSVQNDPDNHHRVYVGTTNSGLWRTEDVNAAVPVWTNMTNSTHFPGIGINWILIDPTLNSMSKHDIYIATGLTRFGSYGVGVLKSVDDGLSWSQTGLSFFPQSIWSANEVVSKLLMDPTNHNIIYASTSNTVYKTTDAGVTWTDLNVIHPVSNLDLIDMEFDPEDLDVIYFSGHVLLKYTVSNSTWQNIATPDLTAQIEAWFGVELAVSDNNLYVLYSEYVSGSRIHHIDKLSSGSWSNYRVPTHQINQLYFGFFEMSPTDPNIIYVEGSNGSSNSSHSCSQTNRRIAKSIDGGVNFFTTTYYWATDFYNSTSTHADIRCFKVVQGSATGTGGLNDILISGNDGGVLFSEYAAAGGGCSQVVNWKNANGQGLTIGQFFGIAGFEERPDVIVGGSQDNGEWTLNNSVWSNICSGSTFGDAWRCTSDKSTPPNCYVEQNFPGRGKSSDYGLTFSYLGGPVGPGLASRPMEADVSNNLGVGHHDLFLEIGGNWIQKSNFTANNNVSASAVLNVIKFSEANPDWAYVAFDQPAFNSNCEGKIFLTRNLTSSSPVWEDIGVLMGSSFGGISAIQYCGVSDIALDPNNENRIWCSLNQFAFDGNGGGKFRVIYFDYTTSIWTDYSDGLTGFPTETIIYQQGSDDALYVGTDVGVFFRDRDMFMNNEPWECFNYNLPQVIITDLVINHCTQKIRSSTYGYGIWESPLTATNMVVNSATQWYNETRKITSDIIIQNGATLSISLCTIEVAKGRRITVESGGHLIILASQLNNTCDEMWDGIYVEHGGTLAMGSCTLQNAYRAVNLDDGSVSSVEDCTFDKNFIGISSHDFSGSSTSTIYPTSYIAGCTFNCTGNLPPYFGGTTIPIARSWAYTGIQLSNVGAMFVGDVAKNVNIFQNLTNGIVSTGSNLEVVNSKFNHIVDYHVYNNFHDGTAILSVGGNGVYSLQVTGLGTPAMTPNQTFYDCKAGIKTFRNVGSWIESCWMEDVDYGFEALGCNYVNSTITNNYFDCNFMGTLFNQCDINNTLSIGDNTYVMTPASRYVNTLPSYAIQVLESGFQNYSSAHLVVAQNNILLEFGLGGILISNVNNAWVKWNQVTTFQNNNDPNSSDLVNAISVNGCDQAYVSCNQIQSMDNTSSSEQIGLHSSGSENGRYLCNNITSGFHGMHFGGAGYGNEISGNVFSDYYIGFYIESTGYSGSQFHNGNIWDDINPNSPIGAFNNNSTSLAFTQLSLFDVKGSLVSDVHPTNNLETPIWGLPAWFTDDPSTDDYMCGSSLECAIVDVWEPNPNIDDINAADYVIANGQVGAENYSEQLVWTSKMNLYKKLDRIKNELPPSEPLLNFYDELANSTIAKLEEINNLISNGSEVDPVYGSILQGNVDPLNVSFENLKLKYESYFNETDDSVRLTYMLDIEMLQNQIQSLSSNSNNAILQIENLRTAEVLQAELENGGIETQVAIEENERLMKDILANYLDESFERFTEEDSLIINEIATKCPYEGGCRAVYLARSFYYMLHGPTFFNDPDNCTPLGYFRKSNKDYFEDNTIQVVPNPFQNSLQIILGQELSENGEFVLFNLIGERVLNVNLSKDQKQFEVLTQNIKSGFYYFKIVSNNSVFGTGKILKVGE